MLVTARRSLTVVLTVATLVFGLSCAGAAAATVPTPTGSAVVSGTVYGATLEASRIALPGTLVTLSDAAGKYVLDANTGASGSYEFSGLAAGSYTLLFDARFTAAPREHEGQWGVWAYDSAQVETPTVFTVADNETKTVIASIPLASAISGRVTEAADPDRGVPGGFVIVVTPTQNVEIGYARTDANGYYTLWVAAGMLAILHFDVPYLSDLAGQTWPGPSLPYDPRVVFTTSAFTETKNAQLLKRMAVKTDYTFSGSGMVGTPITVEPATWTVDGVSASYEWVEASPTMWDEQDYRSRVVLGTGTVFTPSPALIGKQLTVWVHATKAGYADRIYTPEASVRVIPTAPRVDSVKPIISGSATVGTTLTVTTGTWRPKGVTFRYQWFKDGRAIIGETGPKMALKKNDIGFVITVTVTGSKTGYLPKTAISRPTHRVMQKG